jgi:UDP:flavonoid glycosyltransferase YjiC (YdhE family)
MPRFAFVSHTAWGHLDFGGRSFLRTARELSDRGHEVVWLLAPGFKSTQASDLVAASTREGIAVESIAGPLALFPEAGNPRDAVTRLASRLRHVDVCVVDRLAVFAGVAAYLAGVPWVSVGTQGGCWRQTRDRGVQTGDFDAEIFDRICTDLGAGDYPSQCRRSFWLISPFLNLSFFPRAYYETLGECPAHFLGSAAGCRGHTGSAVLVTLGTTFGSRREQRMLELFDGARQEYGGEWTFLASGSSRPNTAWIPYDDAFKAASVAIGHGGNAFLWQAMREGIPVLSTPTRIGDQTYGAAAAARLGMGLVLDPDLATPADVVVALTRLAGPDGSARTRALELAAMMSRGGGVGSAATLLERWASRRQPCIECVADACCC